MTRSAVAAFTSAAKSPCGNAIHILKSAKDSPIILADEPTGNLDSQTSKEIIELLYEVSKNKLVIVVTHNFEQLEGYATRHIRVFDGAIESDHVTKKPNVQQIPEQKEEY